MMREHCGSAFMSKRPSRHPPLRHCPVCGVAMQATRTREDVEHFDRFECLNCQTTISAGPGKAARPPRDGV